MPIFVNTSFLKNRKNQAEPRFGCNTNSRATAMTFDWQVPISVTNLVVPWAHLPWNMKKVLRRYPFEILCGNWSLPYTGWEKPKKQIFPSAPTEISQFQNMASIETNKIKKWMPLLYINFWKLTTLLFCPKWFIHSKGPKNAICLWLSLW